MIEDISNEKRVRVDARPLHGSRPRRSAALGRRTRGDPRRHGVGGNRALLRRPQLHDDLGAARAARRPSRCSTSTSSAWSSASPTHAGMLDKFIGDAIMAVFGLPVAREDDEDRAVRAADRDAPEPARVERRARAARRARIDMGIGLNTDLVVAGNIGSPKRMDYTMIGDGVNLASRLEGACKQYGATILLSELTKSKLKGVYRLREVDSVIVKGKTMPVRLRVPRPPRRPVVPEPDGDGRSVQRRASRGTGTGTSRARRSGSARRSRRTRTTSCRRSTWSAAACCSTHRPGTTGTASGSCPRSNRGHCSTASIQRSIVAKPSFQMSGPARSTPRMASSSSGEPEPPRARNSS